MSGEATNDDLNVENETVRETALDEESQRDENIIAGGSTTPNALPETNQVSLPFLHNLNVEDIGGKEEKRGCLPLMEKVTILKALEKGETAAELSKKYNVCEQTIGYIRENKQKILDYIQMSSEKGIVPNWMMKPRNERVFLPLSEKVKVLEALDKGQSTSEIAAKYGVVQGTVYCIRKKKDKILAAFQKSKEQGKEDILKQNVLPKKKHVCLSLANKVKILEAIEKGESMSDLAAKYEVCDKTIYDTEKNKNTILTQVKNSKEKGQAHLKNRMAIPKCERVSLSLLEKMRIIKAIEEGEELSELSEKYRVCQSTLLRITNEKDKILAFMKNSKIKKNGNITKLLAKRQTAYIRLPLSEKIKIVRALEKGKDMNELAEEYGVHLRTIRRIEEKKDSIFAFVQNSQEKVKRGRANLTPVHLSYPEKAKVLEELKKGETQRGLAKKYGVSPSTIALIKKKKDEILALVQNPSYTAEADELNLSKLVRVKVKQHSQHKTVHTKTSGNAEDNNPGHDGIPEIPNAFKFEKPSSPEIEDSPKNVVKEEEEQMDFLDDEPMKDNSHPKEYKDN